MFCSLIAGRAWVALEITLFINCPNSFTFPFIMFFSGFLLHNTAEDATIIATTVQCWVNNNRSLKVFLSQIINDSFDTTQPSKTSLTPLSTLSKPGPLTITENVHIFTVFNIYGTLFTKDTYQLEQWIKHLKALKYVLIHSTTKDHPSFHCNVCKGKDHPTRLCHFSSSPGWPKPQALAIANSVPPTTSTLIEEVEDKVAIKEHPPKAKLKGTNLSTQFLFLTNFCTNTKLVDTVLQSHLHAFLLLRSRLFPQFQIPVVIAYAPATLTFHYVAQETWVIIQQDNVKSTQVGSLLEISLAYPHSKERIPAHGQVQRISYFLQGLIVFEVTTDSTFTRPGYKQNSEVAVEALS
ncbi:hypothetical protein B0H34DRAFT_675647 [Crassisporium funariophilum]|nr:hypothetical protein B0H34DRAFT_675647 [Crassisporium funariophilum]